ncbi:hypothetical protein CN884_21000 [Ochrobactrum sp. 30A/1000/2015]|nr:hypothetical protein CN884_21000 [Ochrobactrum sp. 30A/1000/2015]PJT39518.1 hypothetical protein CN883_06675 [Ochrobactrum sp. 27A/999/2015]PJT43812.1 hypothetical protein CN882_07850 [Ochrobactrum sp. 23A/997/2015]HWK65692.1 hypothetical protein [Rhizobiaceae bacterium]
MLYLDIPTRNEISFLAGKRGYGSVSIYLKTSPLVEDVQASRIDLKNFIKEAQNQLEDAAFDKRRLAVLLDGLNDLLDDDEFWRFQANSLAIFATPDSILTYRLANDLTSMVQVADRFHLKPLFRAITFPHSAFVLALSENAVRLIEVHADLPADEVKVPNMPKDAASAAGKSTLNDRTFSRRIHGSEGQNVRFEQYVRKVDAALRPILAGREIPLILAATGRLAELFKQISSYGNLLSETITISPDRLTPAELATRARPVLDGAYAAQIAEIKTLFEKRESENRTTTDISDAARAATFGAIQTLLVDIDSVVAGFVDDETGAVTFVENDDAKAYGVVDQITARAFASGATILAVRKEEIPGGGDLAAILRYPR